MEKFKVQAKEHQDDFPAHKYAMGRFRAYQQALNVFNSLQPTNSPECVKSSVVQLRELLKAIFDKHEKETGFYTMTIDEIEKALESL